MEKRKIKREAPEGIKHAMYAVFHNGEKRIRAEILNFHFKGACFKIKSDKKDLKNIQDYTLKLNIGQKLIKESVEFRVCWLDRKDFTFGVEFSNTNSEPVKRAERFITHEKIKPIISSKDPLDPHRNIILIVEDLSNKGMQVSTSLSNKHLFPGMKLKECQVSFHNGKSTLIDIVITNCKLSSDGKDMRLGCEVILHASDYKDCISEYLNIFAVLNDPNKIKKINKSIKKQRKLKHGLSFKNIEDDTEYEKVVELRYLAFLNAGKSNHDETKETFREGLENEGRVIGAYLGSQLVAAVEIRLPLDNIELNCSKYISDEDFSYEKEKCIEINKLVVHPDLQSTDILIGLFQKLHSVCISRNLDTVVISTTAKLRGLYKKIGAVDSGLSFDHPRLENTKLHLMILPKTNFQDGKDMNPLVWETLYKDLNYFSEELGINKLDKKIYEKSFKYRLTKTFLPILKKIQGDKKKKNKVSKTKVFSANNTTLEIPVKYTEQHMIASVILPYILVAQKEIGVFQVEQILNKLGVPLAYLKDKSSWVSVAFLDDFLTECEGLIDMAELAEKAGRLSMQKEVLGVNYYVLKHFPSYKIACQSITNFTTRLNQTRKCEYIDFPGQKVQIKVYSISGVPLPKHKEGCLNWQASFEESIKLVNGEKGTIIKKSCCYEGDDSCTYEMRWESKRKRLYSLLKLCLSFLAVYYTQLFVSKYFESPVIRWGSSFITFSFLFIIDSLLNMRGLLKSRDYLRTEFIDYQIETEKKYSELQKGKKLLGRKYLEAQLLNNISEKIQRGSGHKEIISSALDSICLNFNFDRAMLMIFNKEKECLECIETSGALEDLEQLYNFKVDLGIERKESFVMSNVFKTKGTIIINESQEHLFQLNKKSQQLIKSLKVEKFIMIAIPGQDQNWGVLAADRHGGELITINDAHILEQVGIQLGISLDAQARLEKEANLRKTFQKFVPARFANDQYFSGTESLGGTVKKVACMFLDLREFTAKSQNMPAAKTLEFLNVVFEKIERHIRKNGGIIDKFLGDGLMATWIGDQNNEIDFHLPYQAAISIISQLNSINEYLNKNGWPEIQLGMGLSAGDAIVGNVGSVHRMELTCIGTPINLAARLEALCKKYDTTLVCSKEYEVVIKNSINFTRDSNVKVRGFEKDQEVYYLNKSKINLKGISA